MISPDLAETVRRLTTVEWLQERLDNCLRIAGSKVGSEKRGWLEDAAYFKDAIAKIASLESSLAEARKGARTKGTVEVCPKCKLGTDALGSSWCRCEEGNCPVHEANGWT